MNGVNSSVEGKSLVPHQKKCLEACKYLWARLSNHRNSMGIRKYLSGVGFSSNSCWRSTVSLSVWTQGPACGPAVASDILSVFFKRTKLSPFCLWLFQASQQDPQHWSKSTEALCYPGNVGPEFQWHHGNPKRLLSAGTSYKGAVSFSCWEQLSLSYHSRGKGLKSSLKKGEWMDIQGMGLFVRILSAKEN